MDIASAIRHGPSLPKLEPIKFGGDPLDFAVFEVTFRETVDQHIKDDSQRFLHLLAQCTGKAKDAIRGCATLPIGSKCKKAWDILRRNFGLKFMVVDACLKRLQDIHLKPRVDGASLLEFARKLEDTGRILENMGPVYSRALDNEEILVTLMKKLPDESIRRKWVDKAGNIVMSKGLVEYEDFVEFVRQTGEKLNNRFGKELKYLPFSTASSQKLSQQQTKVTALATQNEISGATKPRRQCPKCSEIHKIWQCKQFKNSTIKERTKIVRDNNLCFRCLGDHFRDSCDKDFVCRNDGCGMPHHTLLHRPKDGGELCSKGSLGDGPSSGNTPEDLTAKNSQAPESSAGLVNRESNHASVAIGALKSRVCFKIVPVRVVCPESGKEIHTYAFLDNGSDTSLCDESLVRELNLEATPLVYNVGTVSGKRRVSGKQVSLDIKSLDGNAQFDLDVLTTANIPVSEKHFATKEDLANWPHLDDITLPVINTKFEVKILIGADRPDIIEVDMERRSGEAGQPFATKTPLGWTVFGPMEDLPRQVTTINFVRCKFSDEISKKLMNSVDNNGEELGCSIEDLQADNIMRSSAVLKDGHYQVRMPFRCDPPGLPESEISARRRLMSLKKRIEKDPEFGRRYNDVLEEYEKEGSSQLVSSKELEESRAQKRLWYLPHHAVWKRGKDSPRVVFDCAAESHGVSLNSQLLKGPDNTNTLVGVILRFRVGPVAVAADIKRMFHQVQVPPADRGTLCYLWWPSGDITQNPRTYQMLVHIFGAKSSPSVASFALRKTAEDNSSEYSAQVVEAVYRDFYVDDLLKSFMCTEEAIEVSNQLKELLSKGGFELTKFLSNVRQVMDSIPIEERALCVKELPLGDFPTDKALGILWNIQNDTFQLAIDTREYPETRRGVLASVASIYDPLGVASPLVLPGRQLNQELCRMKYGWDDVLPSHLLVKWKSWREGLQTLDLSIPRCYIPNEFGEVAKTELHHFADASQDDGYGAVSYLRFVNHHGGIHCAFVKGKSRVKPLGSAMTVPKLELTAATLATLMNEVIVKELDGRIKIGRVVYWTDSTIVLGYIRNETKRFVTFVSNRVATIRKRSQLTQWRHVRSEDNPADLASRGMMVDDSVAEEKLTSWKRGPPFLWCEEELWPKQPHSSLTDLTGEEEGIKRDNVVCSVVIESDLFWDKLFQLYSSWHMLVRIVARLKRIAAKWKAFKRDKPVYESKCLTVQELDNAEKEIVKKVQRLSFPEGFNRVTSNITITGRLAPLKPYVEDGILRVGGRLQMSDLSHSVKHPVILPGAHVVTGLIVRDYHESNGHVGTHQVLALTRQKFWILKGVSSIRRILRRCHVCRKESARVGEQVTAPLPSVRCSSDTNRLIFPFSAVGIDYFGPFTVKAGRATRSNVSTRKRYGCLFTCLRYRAVHIELAEDLSTDSFMNALIRFMGRRGPPSIIYSDNGTNFRGAQPEVIQALRALEQEKIETELSKKRVRWVFNPPAASHQGGVWERIIRSVKRILRSMLGDRLVNEEVLTTFLVEVERILNDRPITRVSGDINDLEALTPSHILLMRKNPVVAIGEQSTENYRLRWKQVRALGEEFWTRWSKEYLPALQHTQKWLKEKPGFKEGDLVLVVDQRLPKGQWSKGLVTRAYPDKGGIVRRVDVKTSNGTIQRDVRKLCILEEDILCKLRRN